MPKVLIIEDRRENIVFIANNILKPQGYEVITAMDGQTGLLKAQEEKPDLIITDLKLPRMGGLEVLEQLDKRDMNIPAIVMTFHGTEDTVVQALRLGARDYLIKPITIEDMQAALARALKPTTGKNVRPDTSHERLEAELAQTRAALAEREDQLKRLSTASQMAARVPRLEQELVRLKAALAQKEDQFDQQPPEAQDGPKIAKLEQELTQMRNALANRENQLRQVQQYLNNFVKKSDFAEITRQAAALTEDNARLHEALTQAKESLSQAERRANILTEVIEKQKTQLNKYQQHASNLAEELRNLSETVRLLSQDMSHQTKQLEALAPTEKKD